ncbi:glycosyltransferase [Rhizorhapis sp. SPR117]|uniref:glycosyltransferase n=1 Tax=Rhizorhapis sp. SPR117 TaxID=2912611 RepID=UPI001F26F40D|nr:glycosyltransferase [Rhizorhapis sp. SPR117]
MFEQAHLSVLIPVRANDPSLLLERLRLRDHCDLTGTETILTDDGSPDEAAQELREFCEARGWRYARLETAHLPFSLARARNAGLATAQTFWVFFDDADMAYEAAFFRKLHKELALLKETPFSFLSLPGVYLSGESTEDVLAKGEIDEILPDLLTRLALEDPRGGGDNRSIQSFAPASAILAIERDTALSVGGYDEEFHGWGGEDRDFIFRLLAINDALPRPTDFAATRVWNLNDTHTFAGWRALYRLHGDYMARKGLYAFHLYHESNPWKTAMARERNFEQAARKAYAFADEKNCLGKELPIDHALRRSLLFSVYADCALSVPAKPATRGAARAMARFKKLFRNPHAFFRDTQISYLRKIRHLFPAKENEI